MNMRHESCNGVPMVIRRKRKRPVGGWVIRGGWVDGLCLILAFIKAHGQAVEGQRDLVHYKQRSCSMEPNLGLVMRCCRKLSQGAILKVPFSVV